MKSILRMLVCCLLGVTGWLAAAESGPPVPSARRVAELKNLRFGMFICWSFSTFSGKEWTPGVKDLNLFAAKDCDTDQWAKTAKEAGMGYILFLTKHHDGFCLWDTQTTDRKVTKAALGRDVLAELRKSCDKYGVKLALYFSEGEWAWPDKPGGGRYDNNGGHNPELKKAQLKELLTKYGPVEYIWFDHAVGDGGLDHAATVAFCKALQPNCFIGFNHGAPAGDIRLGEMGHPAPMADASGAGLGAGHTGGYTGWKVAEFTYPIQPPHNGGAMWFYSLPMHDQLCLPAEKIYADYLGAVKYENVFALDVGPNYQGRLRDIDVQTLRKVGQYIRGERKLPPAPVSQGKAASASSTWEQPGYEAAKAFDGEANTRWGAAGNARDGWLEVDLGKPATVVSATINQGEYDRIRDFRIEAKQGEDAWVVVATGTTASKDKPVVFTKPATARYFRLRVIAASDVPTVAEFQLHTGR